MFGGHGHGHGHQSDEHGHAHEEVQHDETWQRNIIFSTFKG